MELPKLPTSKLPKLPVVSNIDRVIAAMKSEPQRRWTVAELARIACLSRSAFARRFALALGKGPLSWLADYRLGLARRRLLESDLPLAAIATEVGYACEFAFAKAFKRRFGLAPGFYRRSARRSAGSGAVFRAAA